MTCQSNAQVYRLLNVYNMLQKNYILSKYCSFELFSLKDIEKIYNGSHISIKQYNCFRHW